MTITTVVVMEAEVVLEAVSVEAMEVDMTIITEVVDMEAEEVLAEA